MKQITDGSIQPEIVRERRILVRKVYNRSIRNPLGTHYYDHAYVQTKLYCPLCGVRGLWVEDGPGDVEAGQEYVCAACGGDGCSIGFYTDAERKCDTTRQVVEALRRGMPTNIDPVIVYPERGH